MSSEIITLPEGYHVHLEIPVWWGDQDAFGHVNNTVYFRWFESARIEYSNRIGLTALMDRERIGPILASVKCDFRLQSRYPDTVTVGVRISRIGRTSLTMDHTVLSQRYGKIAAEGTSTLVVFDYNAQRPVPVPESIRQAIEKIEGREFSQESTRPK